MKKSFITTSYTKGKVLHFDVAVTPYERKVLRKHGFVDFPKSADTLEWVHPNGTKIVKEEIVTYDILLKGTKITGIKETNRETRFYVPGDSSWNARYYQKIKDAVESF